MTPNIDLAPQLLLQEESEHAFVIARFSPKQLRQTGSQAFIPLPKQAS
jgi:hypothetical protein